MSKVLTIGREYGSNGRLIATKLAEELGIRFYDKDLIGMAAKKSQLKGEDLTDFDEKRANPWLYSSVDYNLGKGYSSVAPINDVLFRAESEVIRELAGKEDCIIVGRCSNFILQHFEHSRHVFVYAPVKKRIATVMERDGVDEKKAQQLIKQIDKRRRLYYNFYTDNKWGSMEDYNLCLDSSAFSMKEILDIFKLMYDRL